MATHQFKGLIVDKGSSGAYASMRVEALDARRRISKPVAAAAVTPTGSFSFSLTDDEIARVFGDATALLFFRVIRGGDYLASTEKALRWNARADGSGRIDLNSTRVLASAPATSLTYAIEGTVSDASGPRQASSITIARLHIDDVSGTKTLKRTPITPIEGAITADARGIFKLSYVSPVPTPDLELTAVLDSPANGSAVLRIPQAQPQMRVDIVHQIVENLGRPLYAEIVQRLQDTGPANAQPSALRNETADSLLHIAARIDQPLSIVTRMSSADRLANGSGVTAPGEVYFGLLSQGEPEDPHDLYARGIPQLKRSLEAAVTGRQINAMADLNTRLSQLATRAAVVLETDPADPTKLPLGKLLLPAVDTVGETSRRAFVKMVLEHEGDADALWAAVDASPSFSPAQRDVLRFSSGLSPLLGAHYPLIQRFHALRTGGTITKDLTSLATLTSAQIDAEIDALPVGQKFPIGTPGANATEQVNNYKAAVKKNIEAALRMPSFRARATAAPLGTVLGPFLTANPSFSFDDHRVATFTPAPAPSAVPELKRAERLYHAAGNHARMRKLWDEGVGSAHDIYKMGPTAFRQLVTTGPNALTLVDANALYDDACWKVTAANAALSSLGTTFSQGFAVMPGFQVPTAVPDWETLFGSLDACACAHCQSVHGPNAYLVDLLQFLRKQPDPTFTTLRARLFARRPDLQRLRLDCDTATTPLPQIDLVNEILELIVANGNPSGWPSTTVYTSATTLELAARPEIKYPEPYLTVYGEYLRDAKYPFDLPFDLWVDETRVVLEHLGVRRSRLIEVFDTQGAATHDRWMWAAELGLNLKQVDILLDNGSPVPSDARVYWGSGPSYVTELANVETFMKKSKLSFAEVKELLAVVWGGGTITLDVPLGTECKPAEMQLVGLNIATLWNLHRFLRLRAALGCSTDDLAKACFAFAPTFSLGVETLTALGTVHELVREWQLALPEAVALFRDMDCDSGHAPSLYRRVYLEKRLHPIQAPDALVTVETGGSTSTGLRALAPILTAALGVAARDLDTILDARASFIEMGVGPSIASDDVDLANLSQLYRLTLFARATQMQLRDLLAVRRFTTGEPLNDATSPETFRAFLRRVTDVRASALTVDGLIYLVRNVVTPGSSFGLDDDAVNRLNDAVEKLVATALRQADEVLDPEGKTTERLLSAVMSESEVPLLLGLLRGDSVSLPGGITPKDFMVTRIGFLLEDWDDADTELLTTIPGGVTTADRERRYTYLAKRLARYDGARRSVIDWLAATFSLDAGAVAFLIESGVLSAGTLDDKPPMLRAFLPMAADPDPANPTVPAATRAARADLFRRFDKVALLVGRLGLSARALRTLYPAATMPTGGLLSLELDDLPLTVLDPSTPDAGIADARGLFSKILRLSNLARLRDRWPMGEGLFDLLDAARLESGSDPIELFDMLARHTGYNRKDVTTLGAAFAIDVVALRDEHAYLRLEEAFGILNRLGASATDAIAWAKYDAAPPATTSEIKDPPATSSLGIAQAVTQTARAKYDTDGWSAVARPIRDELRKKQRDVLVSHLMAKDDLESPDALFSKLYLDVQMGPIQQTSRAVAAAGSIQIFVQRAMLSLDGASLSEEATREWRWMKSYRVWEANRKVFLFPENYIDPMLRVDKSPLFKKLEQDLRQGELTFASAEAAYRNYLDGLAEVANLEVLAVYDERVVKTPFSIYDKDKTVVHVLGRTAEPHKYFHRTRVRGRWTAWERVDLDVKSDHFVFVSHGGRLYLVWLLAERVPMENVVISEENHAATPVETLYGIGYSVREANGTWGRPVSQPRELWKRTIFRPLGLVLSALSTVGRLEVRVSFSKQWFSIDLENIDASYLWTRYVLDPCTHTFLPSLESSANSRPPELNASNQRWLPNSAPWPVYLRFGTLAKAVLTKSISQGSLTTSEGEFGGVHYVYRDAQRSFFIEKKPDATVMNQGVAIISYNGSTTGSQTAADPVQGKASVALFSHPYCCVFQQQLNAYGLAGLLEWSTQGQNKLQLAETNITSLYAPSSLLSGSFPVERVDFSDDGAYSLYNWELFFHAPFQIAMSLMGEQRFEEAQRWLHYIFDPTEAMGGTGARRSWKVKPFYDNTGIQTLTEDLENLAESEWTEAHHDVNDWLGVSPTVKRNAARLAEQIAAWRAEPFDPHAIARRRPLAYQKMVVMKYIENLVAWGDQLFTQDTLESTNEAAQLYLLALEILGKRPVTIDGHDATEGKTYQELGDSVDAFSNAVEVEVLLPNRPPEYACGEDPAIPQVWTKLYFCVPQNETLLGLWDVVEDRLFKLRNAMNIEGIQRTLPLFAPPIDPALLVRATAAGIDIASVLNDLAVSSGPYRFTTYVAKALELAQVVASYGQTLLATLEKRDAEELANLRASQEITLQETILATRRAQIDAAKQDVASAKQSRKPIEKRLEFYRNVDFISATEGLSLGATVVGGVLTLVGQGLRLTSSVAQALPDAIFGGAGWAASPVALAKYGGSNVGNGASEAAAAFENLGSVASLVGQTLGTVAAYDRRWDEWKREEGALAQEALLVDKQIVAAQLRQAVAETELASAQKQLEHSKDMADRMVRKLTNQELYEWMKAGMSELYFQAYNMAYEMAKRAERAFQNERGDDGQSFIQFGYWDGLKKGLLSGERLVEAIRRMDAAYYVDNQRELEIVKHVPLSKHAPEQLLSLREAGVASFALSETDFDRDYPLHWLRRIKTASLSLECTTGPYDGVHGALSLLRGQTRKRDNTLATSFTRIQSIVTSQGREDGGLFELALRDERLLPFEGVGAHAEGADQWKFELTDGNELDYASINDLILHLRYTARPGSPGRTITPANPIRAALFLLRRDFATPWQAFMRAGAEAIDLRLPRELFTMRRGEPATNIRGLTLYTKRKPLTPVTPAPVVEGLLPGVSPPFVALSGTQIFGTLNKYTFPSINRAFSDTDTYRIKPSNPATLMDAWIIVEYGPAA